MDLRFLTPDQTPLRSNHGQMIGSVEFWNKTELKLSVKKILEDVQLDSSQWNIVRQSKCSIVVEFTSDEAWILAKMVLTA